MPATDVHQHLWPEPFVAALARRRRLPRVRAGAVELARGAALGAAARRRRRGRARRRGLRADGIDRALLALSLPLGIEALPGEARPLLDAWHDGVLGLGAPFGAWGALALGRRGPRRRRRAARPRGRRRLPPRRRARVARAARVAGAGARARSSGVTRRCSSTPGPARGRAAARARDAAAWWPALTATSRAAGGVAGLGRLGPPGAPAPARGLRRPGRAARRSRPSAWPPAAGRRARCTTRSSSTTRRPTAPRASTRWSASSGSTRSSTARTARSSPRRASHGLGPAADHALKARPTSPACWSAGRRRRDRAPPHGATSRPAEVEAWVRALAADPARWRHLVRHDPRERVYEELLRDDHLAVWLICWMEDHDTGFHDHDLSAGAVAVVDGAVREDRLLVGGPPREPRRRGGRVVLVRRVGHPPRAARRRRRP